MYNDPDFKLIYRFKPKKRVLKKRMIMEGFVGFLHIWIKLCTDEVIKTRGGGEG